MFESLPWVITMVHVNIYTHSTAWKLTIFQVFCRKKLCLFFFTQASNKTLQKANMSTPKIWKKSIPTKNHTPQNITPQKKLCHIYPLNKNQNIPGRFLVEILSTKKQTKNKRRLCCHVGLRWMPLAHQYPAPWRFQTSLRSGWVKGGRSFWRDY